MFKVIYEVRIRFKGRGSAWIADYNTLKEAKSFIELNSKNPSKTFKLIKITRKEIEV